MALVLLVPFFSRKLHIPSIFGLILAGIITGPRGLEWISDSRLLALLSQTGLLYLMFLAALEIDLFYFRKNRHKSLFFGVLTFTIPFFTGMGIAWGIFGFPFVAALIIACMFSTHTLIAYPIVRRLNITHKEVVIISIGGTILTDTAVLVLLSVILAASEGELSLLFWATLILSLCGLVFLINWGLPRLARWYFSKIQADDTTRYVFVLTALLASGVLAELAGTEAIVGAFLCGLALNQVIHRNSILMQRTRFIGHALFIPVFLISIGMLIDLRALFQSPRAMLLAACLVAGVLVAKFLAAWITRHILRYSSAEGHLLFGLSSAHAAATIAVVSVGYNTGILDIQVLNATILIILTTCLVSTYTTEHAGRRAALENKPTLASEGLREHHIIVPVSHSETARIMLRVASMLELTEGQTVVFPTHIVTDESEVSNTRTKHQPMMEELAEIARDAGLRFVPSIRIDINVASGIQRLAKEVQATHLIAGWSGQSSTAYYFFGNLVENMLGNYAQMLLVVRFPKPRFRYRQIWVMVPDNADLETNCHTWIQTVMQIRKNSGGNPVFLGNAETLPGIKALSDPDLPEEKNFRTVDIFRYFEQLNEEMTDEDLLILVSARKGTLSFHKRLTILPRMITRYLPDRNCIILFPGQSAG